MTSWSQSLRESVRDEWTAATQHRFVDELLAGTVADDVLARYLVQDYQFCDAFVALLGQACATAPDLPSRLRYARQLGVFAGDEDTYFADSFDALGVGEQDRTAPQLTEATRAFDRVMRDANDSRSYAQVVAVLLVAEWLDRDWAERADDEPMTATRPEHVGWVDLHRGRDFRGWVEWLRAELDDDVPEDEAERAAVEAAFRRAVSCELAFFEAAYQR
ncbi:TenA family protein [Arsenicicoccus dermatophilus]|uniref:TenA family protein n=1 Tax=Arsenicicoccus dermatophilus TaxID=1076331 RepID=UPI001F4C9B09|nr:TenA family protein [Arsenicicoccus dermatophilus]MCH8614049.1 TenA family protein [Arsenicicoccus dermatophilus]